MSGENYKDTMLVLARLECIEAHAKRAIESMRELRDRLDQEQGSSGSEAK